MCHVSGHHLHQDGLSDLSAGGRHGAETPTLLGFLGDRGATLRIYNHWDPQLAQPH
jgi:hypothetical protein